MDQNNNRRSGGISVETAHIFPIIKKWLYSEKDIFLRELVSNAADAVTKHKRLISLGEIESELNAKKYGLVWEQHEEAVDVMMRTHIPVFTEDAGKEITAAVGGVYNFLLEGDNLHSLRL